MTTAVQPTQAAGQGAMESAPRPLTTWLTSPVQLVEENVGAFVAALEGHVSPEEREVVASGLLRLLSPQGTRNRTLRRACVEAVLELGYPWALQLDPDDVTEAREAAQAARPAPRWRRALIAITVVTVVTVLGAGVLAGSMSGWSQLLEPTKLPTPAIVERPKPIQAPPPAALQTATRVLELRVRGDLDSAMGLGEACAIAFEAPQPCVQQLSSVAREVAARSNDDFDLYASRQWATLAQSPDALLVRENGRVLLSHDFARDASYLPPLTEVDAQLLMSFVEGSMRLDASRNWQQLADNASNCVDAGGQVGAVCRSFFLRSQVQRMMPPLTRPSDRPQTPDSRLAGQVHRIIDLRVQDRLDDAIDEATRCVKNTPTATDCQHLLAEALARRYRDQLDPADKLQAERWREAVRTTSPRSLWPMRPPPLQ